MFVKLGEIVRISSGLIISREKTSSSNRRIYNVIELLIRSVDELSGGYYTPSKMPLLYDKLTAKIFDVNITVKESTIRNGTEIILI